MEHVSGIPNITEWLHRTSTFSPFSSPSSLLLKGQGRNINEADHTYFASSQFYIEWVLELKTQCNCLDNFLIVERQNIAYSSCWNFINQPLLTPILWNISRWKLESVGALSALWPPSMLMYSIAIGSYWPQASYFWEMFRELNSFITAGCNLDNDGRQWSPWMVLLPFLILCLCSRQCYHLSSCPGAGSRLLSTWLQGNIIFVQSKSNLE